MNGESANSTMVVRFRQPVEGIDPGTGDRFVSDRHTVICAEARQTKSWTWFISGAGVEAARWPTGLVLSGSWHGDPVSHATPVETKELSSLALDPMPAFTDESDDAVEREAALVERLSDEWLPEPTWLDMATSEERRAEADEWDDLSEELMSIGNQGSRAVLWDRVQDNPRVGARCPICGDRVIDPLDHPCRR